MSNWLRGLLQAVAIGFAALILINAAVLIFPANERVLTIALVIAGTVLLATLRWGLWPFQRRKGPLQQDARAQPHDSSEPQRRRRIQMRIVAGLLVVLSLAWALAALAWSSYEDGESRSFILRELARLSAVVVSVAILVMPPLRRGLQQSGYQVTLAILLALGWFAGSIFLPSICRAIADSCHDIEKFVLAIPGWSFLPVAALLLRRLGAQLGVASWRSFD